MRTSKLNTVVAAGLAWALVIGACGCSFSSESTSTSTLTTEVTNEDGKEVALLDDEDEAIAEAARRGLSTEEIEWSELRKKRGIKFVW